MAVCLLMGDEFLLPKVLIEFQFPDPAAVRCAARDGTRSGSFVVVFFYCISPEICIKRALTTIFFEAVM